MTKTPAAQLPATTSLLGALVVIATMVIASTHASAADGTGISIKQVRPGGAGDASATTKPAPKILTIVDSSTPDVEPATRELIARARTLDAESGNFRRETEITNELIALVARGGPDAQRVIFDHWPLFKHRTRGMMFAALGAHFAKNPLHPSAVVPAEQAVADVVDAVRERTWQPGTPPYNVLARMAQRPELTQRVLEEMRRGGAHPSKIAAVMKGLVGGGIGGGGAAGAIAGDDADAIKRLHESAVALDLPSHTRLSALRTLGLIDSERATKALIGIAAGTDPAVDGAELAPLNGVRRTPADHENESKREIRIAAIDTLTGRHFMGRKGDPKLLAEVEQTLIPVFGRIITSTQQHAIRDRALDGLGEFGVAGRLAMVDLYEKETDPPRARLLADRVARFSNYPYTLLTGANQTTSGDGLAFRAAAVRIMRLGITNAADPAPELLRMAEDATADAELRRQATVALLERPSMRQRVPESSVQRLLASPHPEVTAAATKILLRDSGNARYFTAATVRPLFDSPQIDMRQLAIRQTFSSYQRGQLTPEFVLPLLSSRYADVAQAAARAMMNDDKLRGSVGIDTAHRIGGLLGTPAVDQVGKTNRLRAIWLTELPTPPTTPTPTPTTPTYYGGGPIAPAPGGAPGGGSDGGVTSLLWSATWWTAGLFVAALGLIYLFAMLTVPEPRVALTRNDAGAAM